MAMFAEVSGLRAADDAATEIYSTIEGPPLAWDRATLEADEESLFFHLSERSVDEVVAAVRFIRDNRLDPDVFEQEDFRVPSFAREVSALRARLDDGFGVVIVRGLNIPGWSEAEADIIAWGLGNYLGHPVRQGLHKDRRIYTVTDLGDSNPDPDRIGSTSREALLHSDNTLLEPRVACYNGLLCVRAAKEGGESRIISAHTVHNTIRTERPDLLPILYQDYDFEPRLLHRWPMGPKTRTMPIFETSGGELRLHYARVLIEPGMEIAGRPLTPEQTEALDFLDSVMAREELYFQYKLEAGEMMFLNNMRVLHGKTEHCDHPESSRRRMVKRVWLRRRHVGAGIDPAALDEEEFG